MTDQCRIEASALSILEGSFIYVFLYALEMSRQFLSGVSYGRSIRCSLTPRINSSHFTPPKTTPSDNNHFLTGQSDSKVEFIKNPVTDHQEDGSITKRTN